MSTLKEDINKVIESLKEAEDFTITQVGEPDPETGSVTSVVKYMPNLGDLYDDINDVVNKLSKLKGKISPEESETLIKISKTLRNRLSRVIKKYKELKEVSATGGSATFTPGTGAQYATPRAFTKDSKSKKRKNIYYYKMGYKDVPKKIKGSGLEVKKLYEGEFNEFQKGRIDIFEKIENELNDLPPLISNAKNKTVEYYSSNPGSYAIVNSTDLILEYIKDIKTLLKGK
tara:strand:- start:240 stop:929 length:690 start_codon:yes stop_codon:yes gene_type:complete